MGAGCKCTVSGKVLKTAETATESRKRFAVEVGNVQRKSTVDFAMVLQNFPPSE
ncbi:hypothetical protein L0F67_03455 [Actinobacillus suis]|uniref:hypothetical protein n=1 Tax=Actinobacillus suis TaxID=716 RepID=UPI0020B8FE28|nr:hypothetical protein [Actinobacillus suis]UTH26027.1 hypothetical protein L0F67_03455 [Actinobacillus suis]